MSNIDPTFPVFGDPTTESVRDNFAFAAYEVDQAAAIANAAVKRAGDTMTGPLLLNADAVANLQAVTLQQMMAAIGEGGASITVGDTPPVAPKDGALWFDSVGLQTYILYNDGSSRQWTPVINQSGGVGEAAGDGVYYARRNSGWSNVAQAPQVQNNVGRNVLENSAFQILQRGLGAFTSGGMTADRWNISLSLDTISVSIVALNGAQRVAIGDESAVWSLVTTFTGNSGANALSVVQQRIEDVRRLSNKTVTASFWAWCDSGALKLGASIDQNFGTGGSPSAPLSGNGQSVTLSQTPTRYSLTFSVPSVLGQTIGTNNDHWTALDFWYSAGANNAVRSGNVGVQAGVVRIYGAQLELGAQMTPFDNGGSVQQVLARCNRYFFVTQKAYYMNSTASVPTQTNYMPVAYPVVMRAYPTISNLNAAASATNSGPPGANDQSPHGFSVAISSLAAGICSGGAAPGIWISAEL